MGSQRYSFPARVLHWTVAVLVLVQIGLGFAANWSERPLSDTLTDQHVRVGVPLFGFIILRLLWRLGNPPPALPAAIAGWQRRTAAAVHVMLYLLLVLMPLTGYVLWAWTAPSLDLFGLGQVPILFHGGEDEFWRSVAGYAHEYGAYAISALVMVHIAAALHHAFVARDLPIGARMGFGTLDGDRRAA